MKSSPPTVVEERRSSALYAARTHLEKGTLLSDGAVRELATELLELHSANERQDAEIDRLSSALAAARLEVLRLRRAADQLWVEG